MHIEFTTDTLFLVWCNCTVVVPSTQAVAFSFFLASAIWNVNAYECINEPWREREDEELATTLKSSDDEELASTLKSSDDVALTHLAHDGMGYIL